MTTSLTKHRESILTVVRSSKDHPTARQVFERVLRKDPRLSMATVYNSLNFLTSVGYIRRMEAGEEGARYDGVLARHDHLICRHCGHIEDVDVLPAEKARLGPLSGFRVEEVTLRATGLCAACHKKESDPEESRITA